jgi:peptidyl-tRNA hydrolase, PTH2 family
MDNQNELRMVVIFREDLDLPSGKLAAQAGHAFLSSWISFYEKDPNQAMSYAKGSQVKIALVAKDCSQLEAIALKAKNRNVTFAFIADEGRTVVPPGTVTALGLGPMTKQDSNALTRGLKLVT